MKEKLAALTIEDLFNDPGKFGLPTFEQFKRNPDLYRPRRADDSLAMIEAGPQKFRKDLAKLKFKVNGVSLPTIEALQSAITDHGYELDDLELGRPGHLSKLKYKMDQIPQGAGKYDVVIDLLP